MGSLMSIRTLGGASTPLAAVPALQRAAPSGIDRGAGV